MITKELEIIQKYELFLKNEEGGFTPWIGGLELNNS